MIDPTCSNCVFWFEGHPPLATATRHSAPLKAIGTCQRFPPTLGMGVPPRAYWPETAAEQWCGSHLNMPKEPEDGGGEEENGTVVSLADRRAAA